MSRLSAVAPAKLNLTLHITGKRADGYHLLDSFVMFADYGDLLSLDDSEVFSLEVVGHFAADAGSGEHNLVWRAAHVLAHALGVAPRGRLTLEKRLPVGAGLGGGSSDAAVACRMLLTHWGHIMPDAELAALLLPLGADMPMCVRPSPVIARGIGDVLIPVRGVDDLHVVMCWPAIHLPTADVYRAYAQEEGRALPSLDSVQGAGARILDVLEPTRNMLQRAAISVAPEVAELLLAMDTHHTRPFVRMSGSGACCVAYYDTESAAGQLAAALRDAYPSWWVQQAIARG